MYISVCSFCRSRERSGPNLISLFFFSNPSFISYFLQSKRPTPASPATWLVPHTHTHTQWMRRLSVRQHTSVCCVNTQRKLPISSSLHIRPHLPQPIPNPQPRPPVSSPTSFWSLCAKTPLPLPPQPSPNRSLPLPVELQL